MPRSDAAFCTHADCFNFIRLFHGVRVKRPLSHFTLFDTSKFLNCGLEGSAMSCFFGRFKQGALYFKSWLFVCSSFRFRLFWLPVVFFGSKFLQQTCPSQWRHAINNLALVVYCHFVHLLLVNVHCMNQTRFELCKPWLSSVRSAKMVLEMSAIHGNTWLTSTQRNRPSTRFGKIALST